LFVAFSSREPVSTSLENASRSQLTQRTLLLKRIAVAEPGFTFAERAQALPLV
jgi:hypothetical protein